MNSRREVQVVIRGRVQGVWFRAWTRQEAESLGLDGWVRNRTDGTVEAAFAGDTDTIEDMLRRCHGGPPAARVESVDIVPQTVDIGPGFRQLSTA